MLDKSLTWSEIYEQMQFIAEIGLLETGRAIYWATIGFGLALLVSILWIIINWAIVKRFLPEKNGGRWIRRALVLIWVVLIFPLLLTKGVFWGLNRAAEETIVARQLIETGFEQALEQPLTRALHYADEHGVPCVNKTDTNEGFSPEKIIAGVDQLETELVSELLSQVSEDLKVDTGDAPPWLMSWIGHQIAKMVGTDDIRLADLTDAARETVTHANENDKENDDLVSAKQLAWSIGATQGVPGLQQLLGQIRNYLLLFAAIEAFVIVLISTVIAWLITFLVNKMRGSEKEPALES